MVVEASKSKPKSAKAKGKQRAVPRDDFSALEARIAVLNDNLSHFSELPLSLASQKGLQASKYTDVTEIQARAIPLALQGKDILGAARTGSGKTLAFLIPVLENLFRKKWSAMDGLGALVISPTRELAVQIFEVLRKIGRFHAFSAGLVIGGKSVKEEKQRLQGMNILVATPGRLLQHMDETVGFEADNLQMLVLDEADRILDLGFASTINAVVAHLPEIRQTLLFSATQTKSIKDLARLSLKDPEYVQAREQSQAVGSTTEEGLETPAQLDQAYIVVALETKLDRLWSFIKLHLYQKSIVFVSSCKQVRFIYESFRHMQPGVVLLHLHGKQKQMQRLEVYQRFVEAKHAVLFATDIAARGLDFPSVDWVVQVDAPEDVDTYVHRVGRTARYTSKGKALLFLLPSEEPGFTRRLQQKNVQVRRTAVRDSKQVSTAKQLQSLAFKFTDVKFLAQRAFISYVRSVYLQRDKSVFKVDELPLEAFAESFGLAGMPQIKLQGMPTKEEALAKKNKGWKVEAIKQSTETSEDEDEELPSQTNVFGNKHALVQEGSELKTGKQAKTKTQKMFNRKNQTVLSEHYSNLTAAEADDTDDFITLKRADHDLEGASLDPATAQLSKRALKAGTSKKLTSKRMGGQASKLMFDEDGEAHEIYELQTEDDFRKSGPADEQSRSFVTAQRDIMKESDVRDRALAKEKKREKKRKRKQRDDEEDDAEPGATLEAVDEDDGYLSPDFDLSSKDLPDEQQDISSLEQKALRSAKRRKKQVARQDDAKGLRANHHPLL